MITFASMIYTVSLILLLLISGVLIFLSNKKNSPGHSVDPELQSRPLTSDCCGAHEICEFDESIFDPDEIIYFNDEELDELKNINPDQFSDQQINEIREVLYSLRTEEINKWLISIHRRHIHLPNILLQEARLLISES